MSYPSKLTLQNGTKVQRATNHLYIHLGSGQSLKQKEVTTALKGYKALRPAKSRARTGKGSLDTQRYNRSPRHGFFQRSRGTVDSGAQLQAKLGDDASVSAVFYSDKEDLHTYFSPLADVLIAEPAAGANLEELEKVFRKRGLTVDKVRSQYLSGKFYLRVEPGKDTAYELRGSLLRSKSIEKVFFEKVPLLSPTCAVPNDPLFPLQWNLQRIEWHLDYLGCDQTCVIAVIDEGCDLNHPDLNFASPGIKLCTMLPDGSPTGNHGTACAGIAAAVASNQQGVAGVAGRAKILPLAVCTWSDVEIASGIHYAATFGAKVISMSFGVYDWWNFWNYDLIDTEIVFATQQSVFMCAASGNENSATNNRYPAKHPLVMCVGGSNQNDRRKSIGDSSPEPWWGACYGLEFYQGSKVGVDVAAPCLLIPTTDIVGAGGYEPGDYKNNFNGTSSATPQVAGLAALIKSSLPNAGNSLVKKIIEESADKVGGYTYVHQPEFPNSSWTQELGHGRINVRRAMERVRHYACCQPCCCEETGQPLAFSVNGKGHVSKGADTQLTFATVTLNSGGGWSNNVFTAAESGLYYFDWSFVKDSFYKKGTQDDVMTYLQVNNTGTFGWAWSGEDTGRRGTGASSIILALDQGDVVQAMVKSDNGRKRHLATYGFNGYKLAT